MLTKQQYYMKDGERGLDFLKNSDLTPPPPFYVAYLTKQSSVVSWKKIGN